MTNPRTDVNAKLLLASRNTQTGDILYTWELTFPRSILSEVNTHRVASRNTSSSRAISIAKLRSKIWHDYFMPISIGSNQKGMAAGAELTGWRRWAAEQIIKVMRIPALIGNYALDKLGAHKQVANRYLEPWMWTVQVFSATDVNNLLMLRADPAAEPHFHALALQMQAQVETVREMFTTGGLQLASCTIQRLEPGSIRLGIGIVQNLNPGQWHLPYVTMDEMNDYENMSDLVKMSGARCANVSYTLPGETKVIGFDKAIDIYNKLFGGKIKHLSPSEHPAKAMETSTYSGNFRGFQQWRKQIPGEDGGDRRNDAVTPEAAEYIKGYRDAVKAARNTVENTTGGMLYAISNLKKLEANFESKVSRL